MNYECMKCGDTFGPEEKLYTCPKCDGLLEIRLDIEKIKNNLDKKALKNKPPTAWKYIDFMPILDKSKIVSLKEGGTPLYDCEKLAKSIGVSKLYVKHEGANPTGSFKDRGMTVGLTKAREFRVKTVACASTGNTSASLSAYAAKAGLNCVVILPAGKVALGKLAQAIMHGAKVIGIDGNFDDALAIVRRICAERDDIYLLNSVNPFRPQGQKSIGFEIADQLGFEAPDRVIVPMGNCANIWAIYKGFLEFKETGLVDKIPKMTGIQAEGAMPIVNAIKKDLGEFEQVKVPETLATAIRIGNPVNGPKAIKAIRETGGTAESVTDEEIVAAQKELARVEGIGVEPASATTIAGLRKLIASGVVDKEETVVCVTTGDILKDPEEVMNVSEQPVKVPASFEEVVKLLE